MLHNLDSHSEIGRTILIAPPSQGTGCSEVDASKHCCFMPHLAAVRSEEEYKGRKVEGGCVDKQNEGKPQEREVYGEDK